MRIRRGGPGDADAVIALFDEAVAWLVARGQTGQWGSEPTSRNEKMVARVREWAAGDGLWVMDDGAVVGALVVGERPEHVHAVDEPELYVELLLSSRARAGERIGARLVGHAVALGIEPERRQGVRSRWDRSATRSRSAARSSSMRSARRLSASATSAISGGPVTSARACDSPLARARLVRARSAAGRVTLRASRSVVTTAMR